MAASQLPAKGLDRGRRRGVWSRRRRVTAPGGSSWGRRARILPIVIATTLLTVLGSSVAASADHTPRPTTTAKWQQAMERLHVPGRGCFTSSFPAVQWRKTPCEAAPDRPYPPRRGHRPQTVGNGNDFAAEVAGLMSAATGSFDGVSAGATETGQRNGSGPQVANTFSLQLNVKPFTSAACSGSGNPGGCQGWEQFVYSTTSNSVFIQFWLLKFNAPCPSGWNTFSFPMSTDIYCFRNSSASAWPGSALTASDLSNVTLTGSAAAGGNDAVVMTTGSGQATATNADSLLSLASGWKGVEFAVVGDCCSTEANFSSGTTLRVRTTVHNGTKLAPACKVEGFTGETNNLNLSDTPAIGTQGSPTIVSSQTSSAGSAASCASADGLGDTHLTTFRNLLYDFQSSGDFELATTSPRFIVQTRQVSGAPSWPNAAINRAVATRVGKSTVAVCLAPTRVIINKKKVNLANGVQRNLPDGGDVTRYGNLYLIRSASGNSVQAVVNPGNPSWMDVSVGLDSWPNVTPHGLLANAGTNVSAIQSSGGTVLTAPFTFSRLYGLYSKSWRLPASQSLLSVCGGKVVNGDPKQLMYAGNLPPERAAAARAICLRLGLKAPGLLDACTVDVAVFGSKIATQVYRRIPANVTWGKIKPPAG